VMKGPQQELGADDARLIWARIVHTQPGHIVPRDRGPPPEMGVFGRVKGARRADLFANLAFPLDPKTLYGAARLCHRQTSII
jgi:hypothetical protein